MSLFHVIDDAVVILRNKGIYKQAKVYQRNDRLYAAYGSGYIGLSQSGTSVPNVSVDELALGFEASKDPLGRLYMPGKAPRKV